MLRCCQPPAGGKQLSTGELHLIFRASPFQKRKADAYAFMPRVTRLETLWCCRRRAGGKQLSTGELHLIFRASSVQIKEADAYTS